MLVPRHHAVVGTHHLLQLRPWPRPHSTAAAARQCPPACLGPVLGKLHLCKRKDDQVWKCCSIIFTICVFWCCVSACIQEQGSLRLDGARFLLRAPCRPQPRASPGTAALLLAPPPALSCVHNRGLKSIHVGRTSKSPGGSASRIPGLNNFFWNESRNKHF